MTNPHALFFLLLLTLAPVIYSTPARSLTCRDNIAIVPPDVKDKLYADSLITVTRKAFLEREKLACEPFLTLIENNKAFSTLGITSYQSVQAEHLSSAALHFLAKKVTLTHIAFLSLTADLRSIKVVVYAIDQTREQETLAPADEILIPLVSQHRSSWMAVNLWRIRPNAITTNSPTRTLNFQSKTSGRTEGMKQDLSVNSLGSGTIATIEHPAKFGRFGWSFGLSPLASGYIFAGKFYRNPTALYRENVGRLDTFSGCAGASVDASFHSPLGASYFSYSIAPCLMLRRNMKAKRIFEVAGMDRPTIGQRAFFYKNDFIFLERSRVRFTSPIYEASNGKIYSFDETLLGFGVFIP